MFLWIKLVLESKNDYFCGATKSYYMVLDGHWHMQEVSAVALIMLVKQNFALI